MARKFLSFLGTGNYEEGIYILNESENGGYKSNFIQEALIKTACREWKDEDKAIIFLTNKARKYNWNNEEDENRRLEVRLKYSNIEILPVSIPDGKTEEEIWNIFDIVSNQIDEGDEIVLDITHSFRSIPMLALVVLNYAKVVKDAKILKIYYGAWEAKDGKNIAPIFDLTPLDEILEWSQAVNAFLKYGNSGHLKDISINPLKPELPKEQWARDTRYFIGSLNDLTMCLYTCRGMSIKGNINSPKKSISAASKNVVKNFETIKKIKEENQIKPLIPLIGKIEEEIDVFNKKDNLHIGLEATKWYIDKNLIQQAYTSLDETIKTYVCIKFDLDSTNKEQRESIANSALNIKQQKIPESKWNVKSENIEIVRKIVENLDDELVVLSDQIGKKRNDLNHFGFNKNLSSYDSLETNIKKYYDEFVEYIS